MNSYKWLQQIFCKLQATYPINGKVQEWKVIPLLTQWSYHSHYYLNSRKCLSWKRTKINTQTFSEENAFKNFVCKMSFFLFLFRSLRVNPSGTEIEIFWDNETNTMSLDALNPCVVKSPVTIVVLSQSWEKIKCTNIHLYIDGIQPKGPYPPCLCMADRALLARYPRYPQTNSSLLDVTQESTMLPSTCSSSSYCRLTLKWRMKSTAITRNTSENVLCTHRVGELERGSYYLKIDLASTSRTIITIQ